MYFYEEVLLKVYDLDKLSLRNLFFKCLTAFLFLSVYQLYRQLYSFVFAVVSYMKGWYHVEEVIS